MPCLLPPGVLCGSVLRGCSDSPRGSTEDTSADFDFGNCLFAQRGLSQQTGHARGFQNAFPS